MGPALGALLALGLGACGGSGHRHAPAAAPPIPGHALNLAITENGRTASYTVPASSAGGLVHLELLNQGHTPHAAQLVRFTGHHTPQQVLMTLGARSRRTPSWIRAQGGLGPVGPGTTGAATLELPAGRYLVADLGTGQRTGPPAFAPLTLTAGAGPPLPRTPTSVTAAVAGRERYRWQIRGHLVAGVQSVTFNSRGARALHQLVSVRITGHPSTARLIRDLGRQTRRPPAYVDPGTIYSTAVLDGGRSQVTPVLFAKPGTYIVFCPLTDRNGGRPHYAEGLLTRVTIK